MRARPSLQLALPFQAHMHVMVLLCVAQLEQHVASLLEDL
jgi:hypothetical protein